ncbi:formylglycine-generating enzyme family protein [Fusobacterium hwasookii]|uniref:formylglycine-generating enzyme family protein n=5 Tax=Fusobacterium hwasookii TaxID=1583098 RepID=UPI00071AED62|nr:SUMF1/EgtB/PvdO family nonheme iron enzyme [Fusobacterium hwasookii]ALQ36651.1 transcriptional regulator [Fusobacterium hwasookii ChDC F300]QNE68241.1 SUMF1/EgtB/PvdO family nonheme iron enzyme [Fusobacterium hwasookii]
MENKEIELKNFEDEYMIKVKGGKYKPSFANELKEVFDIEVCKYLTTQKMWLEVMENNPSGFKGENRPVETVSWWEVLEYCNRLSEKYGLEPVYELSRSSEGTLMIKELGGKIVSPDKVNFKNTEGFRLPTEVEWEWFASGGQKAIEQGTFNYIYSGSNNIDEVAWYYENIRKFDVASTKDVGLKKSNQLGLYDCSGNVWEWCYDTIEFDENGDYKNIKNGNFYMYKAFDLSNIYRRVKGGSWGNGNKDCAIFHRGCNQAINVKEYFRYFGFRIVRTI